MPDKTTTTTGTVLRVAPASQPPAPRPAGSELARLALDGAVDAVFIVDDRARFVYVNPRACDLLGYTREELLALPIPAIDPRFHASRWPRFWAWMQRQQTAAFESIHRRRDGTHFPVDITINLLEFDGRSYLCAFSRDITSRRDAEERLRNTQERYRQLVEGSLQGIVVDAYDNRPLFVNQAYADLYGYDSPEEIMALESLMTLVVPADRARIEEYTRRRKRGEPSPTIYDFQAVKKDGTRITVLCSVKPIVWDGVSAVQATMLDITDRQRLQDAERDRQAAHARLVGALEASSEGFALFDAADRLYYCNQRYREMVQGIDDLLVPGTAFRTLVEEGVRRGTIPESLGNEQQWIESRLAKHRDPRESIELYRADSRTWVRIREQKLDDGGTFIVASDITRIKDSERELADTTEQLQAAYENMDQGIVMLDAVGRIGAFNQRFVELMDMPALDIRKGVSMREICRLCAEEGGYGPGDVEGLVAERMARIENHETYRFVVERPDGHFLEVRGRPTPTGGHIVTYTDVTETQQLSRELSYQATHDALTGLANRASFEQRVNELLGTASPGRQHALCYVDLDQFKVINDTCGHLAGDELLRQLGGVLPEKVRRQDTLARLGGDEFGLLLENCGVEDAAGIADGVREAIDAYRFVWDRKMFRVGASVGVVPISQCSESVSALLSDADTACYAAKDQGGNRVHVYRANDTELARRRGDMHWVADINRSLESDDFVLFKQPIVTVADGGDPRPRFEILLRLKDEAGNLFEPKSFLRSAERFGLMVKLDYWVLDRMLAWLERPARPGVDGTTYFINISGISLRDDAYRAWVLERLAGMQGTNCRICFEVTETAAVTSLSSAAAFMDSVQGLGHACALDDFGSGLSSFAYLRILPVDYLKIDGQFVRDIAHDPIDYAMVKSITEIARVMNKQTVAEFAESAAVLDRLRELGVDYAQGFAVGHPRPLTDGA